MRINSFLVICLLIAKFSFSQEVIFGTNNYVEYQVGTLPFVISVPHGGYLRPSSIPDRTCQNPVYATDAYTIELALEIKNALFSLTGCFPHIIICHLHRRKLDCNRNITAGACGNLEAETAWNEFHDFITTARNSANQQYSYQTLFVDLHGHGNPIQRIELGYLLYDYELELSDNTLNTAQYINYSSIKNLALNNKNDYTHAELLRGPFSLGTILTNKGFPSVPGQTIPFPGTNSNYFSGGYITANHTCYKEGVSINGLQMELNYNNIRDTPANRAAFASAFAQGIIEYMNTHFNIYWHSCCPLSTFYVKTNTNIEVYPNPVIGGSLIHFKLSDKHEYDYQILNAIGQIVSIGHLNKSKSTLESRELIPGFYLMRLYCKNSRNLIIKKLVVQ